MTSSGLNYVGVALAVGTLFLLVLVQPETAKAPDESAERGDAGNETQATSLLLPLVDRAAESASPPDIDSKARQRVAAASLNADVERPLEKPSNPAIDPPTLKLWDRLTPIQRRALGFCLALIAGLLSGSTFTAPQCVCEDAVGAGQKTVLPE